MSHIVGLDLGSRWIGVATARLVTDGSSPPVDLAGARTLDLKDVGVDGAVAMIRATVAESGARTLVVEWGRYFCPRKAGETDRSWDARNRSMQANREVMSTILALVRAAVATIDPPVEVIIIACATWRRLIGCEPWPRPDGSPGWINDASVRAALALRLGAAVIEGMTAHGCDALGALLGHLLQPARAEDGSRTKSEAQKLRRRILSRESARRWRNRGYVGCGMPARTWGDPPPRNVPVELDGIEATVREHATRLGWSYQRVERRVRLGGLVRRVGAPTGTIQRCETCGNARRNHVCPGVAGAPAAYLAPPASTCGCASRKGHVRGLPCPAAPKVARSSVLRSL